MPSTAFMCHGGATPPREAAGANDDAARALLVEARKERLAARAEERLVHLQRAARAKSVNQQDFVDTALRALLALQVERAAEMEHVEHEEVAVARLERELADELAAQHAALVASYKRMEAAVLARTDRLLGATAASAASAAADGGRRRARLAATAAGGARRRRRRRRVMRLPLARGSASPLRRRRVASVVDAASRRRTTALCFAYRVSAASHLHSSPRRCCRTRRPPHSAISRPHNAATRAHTQHVALPRRPPVTHTGTPPLCSAALLCWVSGV